MVIWGGRIFSIPQPRGARIISDPGTQTPFCMVTRFTEETGHSFQSLDPIETYHELQEIVGSHCLDEDPDRHYAVKIYANCRSLSVQCVQPPQEGENRFAAVGQSCETLEDVRAILVGFQIGSGLDPRIHPPGFHFHAITDNQASGGHVLELSLRRAVIHVQEVGGVKVLRS